MAMGHERSRPLHNFTLPCELKWGNQKFLRCVKLDSNRDIAALHRRANGSSEIASVREKLMFDLQTAADKMKDAILREGLKEEKGHEPPPPPPPPQAVVGPPESASAVDPNKPWSLRTRRSACNGGGSSQQALIAAASAAVAGGGGASPSGEKKERAKFSVPLARREIEEDFMAMVGHRPARRPKKRTKLIQKNLDTLFPGLWLSEITPDLYKVPDDQ